MQLSQQRNTNQKPS